MTVAGGTGDAAVDVEAVDSATATASYQNSIFANNEGVNFRTGGTGTAILTSLGNNIIDDLTGDATPEPTDQLNTDPLIGSLVENSATFVHPLLLGSPAIDGANNGAAPTEDQRGVARVDGDGDSTITADIGAYEYVPLTVDLPANGGITELFRMGNDLVVRNDGIILAQQPLETTSQLTLNGQADNIDVLTIDFDNGDPIPHAGLLFNGGAGGNDSLELQQGALANPDTVEHQFTNENDGAIDLDLDGGGVDRVITYTGLEPIVDNLDAMNRVFTFNGGMETITLQDAPARPEIVTGDTALEVGGSAAAATDLLVNLDGTPFAAGDVIEIDGVDADGVALGAPAMLNVLVTTDVQDLLDAITAALSGRDGRHQHADRGRHHHGHHERERQRDSGSGVGHLHPIGRSGPDRCLRADPGWQRRCQ